MKRRCEHPDSHISKCKRLKVLPLEHGPLLDAVSHHHWMITCCASFQAPDLIHASKEAPALMLWRVASSSICSINLPGGPACKHTACQLIGIM